MLVVRLEFYHPELDHQELRWYSLILLCFSVFLNQIRSNPKKVEIHDLETDNIVLYSSIYKAALALDQNPGAISMYDGKVWRSRYAIKILTESECF